MWQAKKGACARASLEPSEPAYVAGDGMEIMRVRLAWAREVPAGLRTA
jgi:hypothetical protein